MCQYKIITVEILRIGDLVISERASKRVKGITGVFLKGPPLGSRNLYTYQQTFNGELSQIFP